MKVASRASPRRQVAKELPWWRWWRTALRDAQTLENSPLILVVADWWKIVIPKQEKDRYRLDGAGSYKIYV